MQTPSFSLQPGRTWLVGEAQQKTSGLVGIYSIRTMLWILDKSVYYRITFLSYCQGCLGQSNYINKSQQASNLWLDNFEPKWAYEVCRLIVSRRGRKENFLSSNSDWGRSRILSIHDQLMKTDGTAYNQASLIPASYLSPVYALYFNRYCCSKRKIK